MTGHDRLEAVLFGNPERRLVDVKFFVPHGKGITPDMIFNEAASGFEQVDQGKAVGDSDFHEAFEQTELNGLFA